MPLTFIQSTAAKASQVHYRLQLVRMAQYPVCMKYLLHVSDITGRSECTSAC